LRPQWGARYQPAALHGAQPPATPLAAARALPPLPQMSTHPVSPGGVPSSDAAQSAPASAAPTAAPAPAGRAFGLPGGSPVSGAALLSNLSQLQAALAPVAARVARATSSSAPADAALVGDAPPTPREAAKLQLARLVSRFDGVLASHAHASADVQKAVRDAKAALERELAALQDERAGNCVALSARRNAEALREALSGRGGSARPASHAAGAAPAADARQTLRDVGAMLRAANDAASAAALAALTSAVDAVALLDPLSPVLGSGGAAEHAPAPDDKGYHDTPEEDYRGDAAREREQQAAAGEAAAAAAAAAWRKEPVQYDMAALLGADAAAEAARAAQFNAFEAKWRSAQQHSNAAA
jgi:hypothetical protein